MFSRFTQAVACNNTSFLFMAEKYSIAWICHLCLSIHQLVDIKITSFELLWIKLLWIFVQIFMWTYIFTSLGYRPRNEIAGSYSHAVLNIMRNLPNQSTVTAPFCIPCSSGQRFQLLHILANTCHCLSFWL